MTEHRASSGVRNLRAMFENQSAASSPEPRGRSPSRRFNADTNRPTSKVKASFVSVEPSGLPSPPLGTTKGTEKGINSPSAQRRESFNIGADVADDAVAELKKVVSEEKEARKNSTAIPEAIPEQAIAESRDASTTPPEIAPPGSAMPNLGRIMKGSDFPEPQQETGQETTPAATPAPPQSERPASTDKIDRRFAALSLQDTSSDNPDKVDTGAHEDVSLQPADPKDEAVITGGEALPPPAEVLTSAHASEPVSKPAETHSPPKTPVKKLSPRTAAANGTASAKRPAPIAVAKASPAKPAPARAPRTPTTPKAAPAAASVRSTAATKEKPRATAHKEPVPVKSPPSHKSRASSRPATTASRGSAAAKAPVPETKKPAARASSAAPAPKSSVATSPGGFKKPKPRSPTRPARLPSHLTAPTAAFAAKHGDDAAAQKAATRKPATVSRPAAPKTAPPARKPAPRTSAAPAPEKRPASRASAVGGAGEGFLARMMRPTASSASKTHEKPASPPRRGASLRAATKPKTGHESTVAKAKRKVGEVASKTKETVANGHSEDHKAEKTEASAGPVDESTEKDKQAEPVAETHEEPRHVPDEQEVPAQTEADEKPGSPAVEPQALPFAS